MSSAGPEIIQKTIFTKEGGDGCLSACKSLVIYLRFHQNENLLRFSRRRKLDDVLTTSHMRSTLARENFTSARRRRAISLSMLKVPIDTSRPVARHILLEEESSNHSTKCRGDRSTCPQETRRKYAGPFAGIVTLAHLID